MNPLRGVAATAALIGAIALASTPPARAMPPFAQAYGESCETCHTAVPALNAYGRYVQRTGYASLDPGTIHRAIPIWIGESPTFDSMGSPKVVTGNLALHGTGYIGTDWTFHAQEWIVNANSPGFTDTVRAL